MTTKILRAVCGARLSRQAVGGGGGGVTAVLRGPSGWRVGAGWPWADTGGRGGQQSWEDTEREGRGLALLVSSS